MTPEKALQELGRLFVEVPGAAEVAADELAWYGVDPDRLLHYVRRVIEFHSEKENKA